MALIVEDGTRVPNAESYVSVTDADTYWSNRSVAGAAWSAATLAAKEGALREARAFLDSNFRFRGSRVRYDQALRWPRVVLYDDDDRYIGIQTIPQAVKDAQCELALFAVDGTRLLPADDRDGHVASVTVGPISETYQQNAPGFKRYRFVEHILRDVLDDGGFGSISSTSLRA